MHKIWISCIKVPCYRFSGSLATFSGGDETTLTDNDLYLRKKRLHLTFKKPFLPSRECILRFIRVLEQPWISCSFSRNPFFSFNFVPCRWISMCAFLLSGKNIAPFFPVHVCFYFASLRNKNCCRRGLLFVLIPKAREHKKPSNFATAVKKKTWTTVRSFFFPSHHKTSCMVVCSDERAI